MLKKIVSAAAAAVMAVTAAGCGNKDSSPVLNDPNKINIVCTTFPAYDWVMQVAGGHAGEFNVTYLLGSGADLHSFQPSAADMAAISGCDLFVCVGGESEKWVDDALKEPENKNMKVISMMDVIGDNKFVEEEKEGMQAEEEEEEEGGEEEVEYDEHVWMSLTNADLICAAIADDLAAIDADHKADYEANYDTYSKSLGELSTRFRDLFDGISDEKAKTMVVADRFPLRYFVEDYGIDYFAAFVGCSAETEASFETITFLAGKIDELGQDHVFVIEGSDHKIANAVIEATANKNAEIIEINSVQSVTSEQAKNGGTTYLTLMEKNYEAIKGALT
ncbi:zinc transport system substrate-binding protein [Ruminococcus sp. YE71]|uniref:metal ABC transporter substrate-binding protein n=1 Tax=unclassified Ruminococcus TaxID=2608920 RepID=UPI00088D8379|nr:MULTISPECIES: metal ABC transporter substrate-binding protein [unclassified Ruminococcus]SDA17400.1 zinc transport system substrate-binding protein [Ruminococcus sp. YE78]SFW26758.1 zinc transport system substrate-binding protein [Ruminococcus sp. YE71]